MNEHTPWTPPASPTRRRPAFTLVIAAILVVVIAYATNFSTTSRQPVTAANAANCNGESAAAFSGRPHADARDIDPMLKACTELAAKTARDELLERLRRVTRLP